MRQDDFTAAQKASLGLQDFKGGDASAAEAKAPSPEVRFDSEFA